MPPSEPPPPPESPPVPGGVDTATAEFLARAVAGGLLVGAWLRFRVLASLPLPPQHPAAWFSLGLAQDLAWLSAVALLALAAARRSPGAARWLFGGLLVGGVALQQLQAETISALGMLPAGRDLDAALAADTVRRAFSPRLVAGLALTFAAVALALRLAARRVPGGRGFHLSPRGAGALLVAGVAATLALAGTHQGATAANAVVSAVRPWLASHDHYFVAEEPPSPTGPGPGPADPRELLGTPPPPDAAAPPAPRVPPGLRPNIVFWVIEGLRDEELGAFGANPPGLTPTFDALAREGIAVAPVLSAGITTPSAEMALWYGLFDVDGPTLMGSPAAATLDGLPERLRRGGWRDLLFVHGGDRAFYGRDRFYPERGFRMVTQEDFPAQDPRTYWGVTDRALARGALDVFDRAEQPFAGMVLTVSTHHPWERPPDDRGPDFPLPAATRGFRSFLGTPAILGNHTVPLLRTIHYADAAFGEFLAGARARPWWRNTVVVLVGDHGLPIEPLGEEVRTIHRLVDLRSRVPLVLASPLLPSGLRIERTASLADVPETLARFARLDGPRIGAGVDLLDPASAPVDRPVVHWSFRDRVLTLRSDGRAWHATLPPRDRPQAPLEREVLVDPAADPAGAVDLSDREPERRDRFRRWAEAWRGDYARWVAAGAKPPDAGVMAPAR